ncbi:MAG: hypothetical protein AAGB06_01725 [Verrucomicrobiota bacterium]
MKTGRHLNIRIGEGSDSASNQTRPPMNSSAEKGHTGIPFLGIHFVDCHVYGRIYRNKEGSHYEGLCPKCRRNVKIRIGPSGSATRSFKAFCD